MMKQSKIFVRALLLLCMMGFYNFDATEVDNNSSVDANNMHLKSSRIDLKGKILRVGVIKSIPYTKRIHSVCNRTILKGGIFHNILQSLATTLNFKYEIKVTEGGHGRKINNIWTGLVGQMQRKEVDLIMPVVCSYDRLEVLEYSSPAIVDDLTFVSRAPREESRAFAIIKPYSWQIWLLIISSIVLMSICIFTIGNFVNQHLTFGNVLWYFASTNLMQGNSAHVSGKLWFRLVAGHWWLYVLTVVNGFSGTLIAYLNAPILNESINTMEQLGDAVESGQYAVGSVIGSFFQDYLQKKKHKVGPYRKIGKTAREQPHVSVSNSFEHALQRVLSENYIAIGTKLSLQSQSIKMGEHNFHYPQERLQTIYTCLGTSKGFPFRMPISHLLNRMHGAGLPSKWATDFLLRQKRSTKHTESQATTSRDNPLGLSEMIGAFFVLTIGCCISIFTLVIELFCVWNRTRMRIRLKRSKHEQF